VLTHNFGSQAEIEARLRAVLIPRLKLQPGNVYSHRAAIIARLADRLAGEHDPGFVAVIWAPLKEKMKQDPVFVAKRAAVLRALGGGRIFWREVANHVSQILAYQHTERLADDLDPDPGQTQADYARKIMRVLLWSDNFGGFPWMHFNFYICLILCLGGAILRQITPEADQIITAAATITAYCLILAMMITVAGSLIIHVLAAGLDLAAVLLTLGDMLRRWVALRRTPQRAIIEDVQ